MEIKKENCYRKYTKGNKKGILMFHYKNQLNKNENSYAGNEG